MSDPRVSVIVPCYRQAGPLRRCLEGLAQDRQGGGFEVIVVDSGSDGAVRSVAADSSCVLATATAERLWPGAARNLGARTARGAFLLFLDADCVAGPGWVGTARAALESGVRMAGGPVLDLTPYHPIAASDNLLQFAEYQAGRPEGTASKFPSCNLAMRRADFEALGGFPEHLPVGEDTLLTEAAARRWPDGLRFIPGMRVRHLGRTELGGFLAHQAWFGYHRGLLGLGLTPTQRRLARHAIVLPAVVLRRWAYILGRTAAWHAGGLPRALLLSPLVAAGLAAYAAGLRRGLRRAEAPEATW